MCKVSKLCSIVWLRRTLRRWRSRAAARPKDVPAGHVSVCVGGGSRRFVVRLAHLNQPAFRQLLQQAEEEYGFPSGAAASGPISLPCDEDLFLDVLRRVTSSSSSLEELKSGALSCCCGANGSVRWHGDSLPLLREMAVEKLVW